MVDSPYQLVPDFWLPSNGNNLASLQVAIHFVNNAYMAPAVSTQADVWVPPELLLGQLLLRKPSWHSVPFWSLMIGDRSSHPISQGILFTWVYHLNPCGIIATSLSNTMLSCYLNLLISISLSPLAEPGVCGIAKGSLVPNTPTLKHCKIFQFIFCATFCEQKLLASGLHQVCWFFASPLNTASWVFRELLYPSPTLIFPW